MSEQLIYVKRTIRLRRDPCFRVTQSGHVRRRKHHMRARRLRGTVSVWEGAR